MSKRFAATGSCNWAEAAKDFRAVYLEQGDEWQALVEEGKAAREAKLAGGVAFGRRRRKIATPMLAAGAVMEQSPSEAGEAAEQSSVVASEHASGLSSQWQLAELDHHTRSIPDYMSAFRARNAEQRQHRLQHIQALETWKPASASWQPDHAISIPRPSPRPSFDHHEVVMPVRQMVEKVLTKGLTFDFLKKTKALWERETKLLKDAEGPPMPRKAPSLHASCYHVGVCLCGAEGFLLENFLKRLEQFIGKSLAPKAVCRKAYDQGLLIWEFWSEDGSASKWVVPAWLNLNTRKGSLLHLQFDTNKVRQRIADIKGCCSLVVDHSVGDCDFMSIGKTVKPFNLRLQWNIKAWQVHLSPALLPVGEFVPGIIMVKQVGYEQVLFGGVDREASHILVRQPIRTVRPKRPLDRRQLGDLGHRKRRRRKALHHPAIADGVASGSDSEHSQSDVDKPRSDGSPTRDASPPRDGDADSAHSQIDGGGFPCPGHGSPPRDALPDSGEEVEYSPTSPGGGNSEPGDIILDSSDGGTEAASHDDVPDDGDDEYWNDLFADPTVDLPDGIQPAIVAQYTEEDLVNQFTMDFNDLVPDQALADTVTLENNEEEEEEEAGQSVAVSSDGGDRESQTLENNEAVEEEELLLGSEQDEEEVEAQDREQQHDNVPDVPLPPPVRRRKGWIYTPYFSSGWLCFPEAHPHQRLDAHCTNSDHGPRCHFDRTMIGRNSATCHRYGRSAALSAAWLELSSECKTRGEHQRMKKQLCSSDSWAFRCSIRDKMEASGHSGLQYILEEVERQPMGDEPGGEPRSHYYRGDS